MTIHEFFNYILTPFGLNGFVLNGAELQSIYNSATREQWYSILRPDVIFTSILYLGIAVALWQVLLVFPFRCLKHLIGYRSRKSSER